MMFGDERGMVVTVKRLDLIKKIQENRAKHIKQYQAAVVARKVKMLADLKAATKAVAEGKEPRNLSWPLPSDHTGDYDSVLTMLQMSVDKEIKLHQQASQKYIEDRWDWSDTFTRTVSTYRVS